MYFNFPFSLHFFLILFCVTSFSFDSSFQIATHIFSFTFMNREPRFVRRKITNLSSKQHFQSEYNTP